MTTRQYLLPLLALILITTADAAASLRRHAGGALFGNAKTTHTMQSHKHERDFIDEFIDEQIEEIKKQNATPEKYNALANYFIRNISARKVLQERFLADIEETVDNPVYINLIFNRLQQDYNETFLATYYATVLASPNWITLVQKIPVFATPATKDYFKNLYAKTMIAAENDSQNLNDLIIVMDKLASLKQQNPAIAPIGCCITALSPERINTIMQNNSSSNKSIALKNRFFAQALAVLEHAEKIVVLADLISASIDLTDKLPDETPATQEIAITPQEDEPYCQSDATQEVTTDTFDTACIKQIQHRFLADMRYSLNNPFFIDMILSWFQKNHIRTLRFDKNRCG